MGNMTKHHPHSAHDYLPAAGHDRLLPGYDLLARLMGFNRVYKRVVTQAELADGQRILEIGCGTGNLILMAKRSTPTVEAVGSDPDPLSLARAQRKAAGMNGIRFDKAYAQRLPYADGEFDRVLSSMMLHHLDDAAKPVAAGEIFRVLRPGGRLHLVDIGGDASTHRGVMARLTRRNHHAAGNLGDAIPRLLRAAGFECTQVATQPHRLLGQLNFYRASRSA